MASKRMSKAPSQDQEAKDFTEVSTWLHRRLASPKAFYERCNLLLLLHLPTLALDMVGAMTARGTWHASITKNINAELRRTCPSVSSVFKQKETLLVLKTTRAETLLVTTLVDSNLPLLATDKFTKTLKMFPDSEIAWRDAFLTEALNFLRKYVFGT